MCAHLETTASCLWPAQNQPCDPRPTSTTLRSWTARVPSQTYHPTRRREGSTQALGSSSYLCRSGQHWPLSPWSSQALRISAFHGSSCAEYIAWSSEVDLRSLSRELGSRLRSVGRPCSLSCSCMRRGLQRRCSRGPGHCRLWRARSPPPTQSTCGRPRGRVWRLPWRCALCPEKLSVFNWLLATVGLVFVDTWSEFGVIRNQIWNALSVITVPVSQEDVGDV